MNTHLAVVNNVPAEVKVEEEDVGGRKKRGLEHPQARNEESCLELKNLSFRPTRGGTSLSSRVIVPPTTMNHQQYPECCSTKDQDVTAPRQQGKLWEHLESPSKGRRKTPLWPL